MSNEIWKDIKGYEGKYQISNMGRVKSLNYNKTGKAQLLKPISNSKGYLYVCLWHNNTYIREYIHRLVALSFIPNPNNLPCVDHINTQRNLNTVTNLRWVSVKDNLNNPLTRRKNSDTKKQIYLGSLNPNFGNRGIKNKLSIPIKQLDLYGNVIREWSCAKDAEREMGFDASTITKCCKGKKQTHKGYRWEYKEKAA